VLRSPLNRISLIERIRLSIRAAYLRMLISNCEADIEHHQFMQERELLLEREARQRLDELRIALIDCDLERRTS
jgi:hypothetical protein